MIYVHWIWYIVSDDCSTVKPVCERESLGQPPRLMNMYGSLGRRYTRGGDSVVTQASVPTRIRSRHPLTQTIICDIACHMYWKALHCLIYTNMTFLDSTIYSDGSCRVIVIKSAIAVETVWCFDFQWYWQVGKCEMRILLLF